MLSATSHKRHYIPLPVCLLNTSVTHKLSTTNIGKDKRN